MSSISNNPAVNPNSDFSLIDQQPYTFPRRSKRINNNNNNNNNKTRNWVAALPEELWYVILSKFMGTTFDILENVQKVCKLFHEICKQPSLFKVINLKYRRGYDINVMARRAVDRSDGGCVDIYLDYFECNDATLKYIVKRCKNLKHLGFAHHVKVSDGALIRAVKKLPMLKELQLVICFFSSKTVEAVGHACPSLKSFNLTLLGSQKQEHISDADAFAISRSMPNLRRLQLIGNGMTNKGLKAILDKCRLLKSLDLRACFHISLSGGLGKKCQGRIKHLRYPDESTADYGYQACFEESYLDHGLSTKYIDSIEDLPEDVLDYYLGEGDIESFKIYREIYSDCLGGGSNYLRCSSSDSEYEGS